MAQPLKARLTAKKLATCPFRMNSVASSLEEKIEAGVAAHSFTLGIWEAEADLCVFVASLVCIATSRLARANK